MYVCVCVFVVINIKRANVSAQICRIANQTEQMIPHIRYKHHRKQTFLVSWSNKFNNENNVETNRNVLCGFGRFDVIVFVYKSYRYNCMLYRMHIGYKKNGMVLYLLRELSFDFIRRHWLNRDGEL